MLAAIKNLVMKKQEFLESATLLYEDYSEIPFDDEDNDVYDGDREFDDDDEDTYPSSNRMLSGPPPSAPIPMTSDNDLMDKKIDDDLLDVTIDIGSNSVTDTIPVPPFNSGDATTDEMMSTRLSDGFGGTSSDDWDDDYDDSDRDDDYSVESWYSPKKRRSNFFGEAISMGDSGGDEVEADAGGSEEKSLSDEKIDDDGGSKSKVTSAVLDKVDEAEAEEDDTMDSGSGEPQPGSKILDKLDTMQKDIINIKEKIKKELI